MSDGIEDDDEPGEDPSVTERVASALQRFMSEGHGYGDLLTHRWLYEAFDIRIPQESNLSFAEANALKMLYMSCVETLRQRLLVHHKMALRNQFAEGYTVVLPGDQARWAMETGNAKIKKEIAKMRARIKHTALERLTPDQVREHREASDHLKRMAHWQRAAADSAPTRRWGWGEK